MSKETDERRRHRWATWIVVVLVVVFALYPLSIGPANALVYYKGNRAVPVAALQFVYRPVWVVFRVTGKEQALVDYVEWWTNLVG